MMGHHNSQCIDNARTIIQSVQNSKLTEKERCEKAILLAGEMLNEALRIQTKSEKKQQSLIAGMIKDPDGKVFTTSMTDQCFRTQKCSRIADQLIYLIKKFGIPSFLTAEKKIQLKSFTWLGKTFPNLFVPLAKEMVRKETSAMILPGESKELAKHMKKRRDQGVRVNLNHLGEAIIGEEEAKRRLDIYLQDLEKPEVEYISVKISTICSQINLLAWEDTLSILSQRLKRLYRASKQHPYLRADGKSVPKFVNLDMEEYRDLALTVELFKNTLDDPEFKGLSAGIVLQSYLPDSFLLQKQLTQWAMDRVANGGAPIKIRIVKGANLAMEQVESSLKLWPQAPYPSKLDVDANFKRMLKYASFPAHAKAATIGIASHNLFDIAYGLLLSSENNIEPYVCFEMLEGMADHILRVVHQLSNEMLLYCPAATNEEFQNAVAYLVRRFDENTAPQNFLRHAFDMTVGSPSWNKQAELFSRACFLSESVSECPRRTQNRMIPEIGTVSYEFENEPDTDWSLMQNREWAEKILSHWKERNDIALPLVVGGNEIFPKENNLGMGEDPSFPGKAFYKYALAGEEDVENAFQTAGHAQDEWGRKTVFERSALLEKAAAKMRGQRGNLIGAMIADTGKTVAEADVEISEAIDFIEYYRRSAEDMYNLSDIRWKSKGIALVAPPWNFPCSIPVGGISAALAAGNCVLFKPAAEAVLVGWQLVQCFWEAGISREALQFIPCEDEPIGSRIIQDSRLNAIVLTGATATAKLFMKMSRGADLVAETGGKNAMIITNLSDRDLAIKDLIQSAFGHAGQKCSACSLAICEAEVYDDPHFKELLRDAAASLKVGSPWDMAARMTPLIRTPNPALKKGLTELEEGESWLLEPKQDPKNPNLWSPGIKIGVREWSFTHQTELFGPVLGLMRADNLPHAIKLANSTPYGLTSGLHSLDEREHALWISQIEAGNLYINRGITGAIVQRQPFGGCKDSSFGPGAKAGGPNYVQQLMQAQQISLPDEQDEPPQSLKPLMDWMEHNLQPEEFDHWQASIGSYAFYWNHYFTQDHDPSLVLGQDNILHYASHALLTLRMQASDTLFDVARVVAAALITGVPLEVSGEGEMFFPFLQAPWRSRVPSVCFVEESQEKFLNRVYKNQIKRIRLISSVKETGLQEGLANIGCHYVIAPVLANGRLELLHYLREVSLSYDYHRYGNLGEREGEKRRPLPGFDEEEGPAPQQCGSCSCR